MSVPETLSYAKFLLILITKCDNIKAGEDSGPPKGISIPKSLDKSGFSQSDPVIIKTLSIHLVKYSNFK